MSDPASFAVEFNQTLLLLVRTLCEHHEARGGREADVPALRACLARVSLANREAPEALVGGFAPHLAAAEALIPARDPRAAGRLREAAAAAPPADRPALDALAGALEAALGWAGDSGAWYWGTLENLAAAAGDYADATMA